MSQLQKKFIANNAIDGTKIHLSNNESIRARNSADTSDIDVLKITTSDALVVGVLPEVNSVLPVPSLPKQLATIEYVSDAISNNLDIQYTKRVDVVSEFLIYRGEALPNSIESDPVWRISKIVVSGSNYTVTWANGNANLNNKWSDHLVISYS